MNTISPTPPLLDEIGTQSGMMIYERMTDTQQQKPIELKLNLIIRKSVSTLEKLESKAKCKAIFDSHLH